MGIPLYRICWIACHIEKSGTGETHYKKDDAQIVVDELNTLMRGVCTYFIEMVPTDKGN
jgi:hypothetical protein